MKFSVVTISYNQARFLRGSFNLFSRKRDRVDIIVDLDSTEGCRGIIERHRDYFAHIILERMDQTMSVNALRGHLSELELLWRF